jgi:transposase
MTCWRRLRDWQEAGVWEELHRVLLTRLGEADRIDWSRASIDSSTIPAKGVKKGGQLPRMWGRTRPIAASQERKIMW